MSLSRRQLPSVLNLNQSKPSLVLEFVDRFSLLLQFADNKKARIILIIFLKFITKVFSTLVSLLLEKLTPTGQVYSLGFPFGSCRIMVLPLIGLQHNPRCNIFSNRYFISQCGKSQWPVVQNTCSCIANDRFIHPVYLLSIQCEEFNICHA